MLIVLLLSLLFYHQSCFAFNSHIRNPDDFRILAHRVELLEKAIRKGKLKSIQSGGQSFNLDRTTDVYNGSENPPLIKEDKLHVPGQETNNSELKHCEDRILTLERTVRELSRVVTRQTKYIQNVQRLEARVDEQERIISDLRIRVSETENNLQKFETKGTVSKGVGIKDFNASNLDLAEKVGTGISEIMKNRQTNEKYIQSQGHLNKKRLLSPVTTTTHPPAVKSVAFYAYMSQATPNISVQYPLRFDVVKTNVGNGYHSATGVFSVPETGIYVFTWTVRVHNNYQHSTQLIVNTDEIGIIHTHITPGSDFEGTGIVVAHVNAGDDVFVRTHSSWNNGIIESNPAGRSSFAGWKLS